MSLRSFDADKVTRSLFPPDELFPADVVIVLGMSAWRQPLARAVDLYQAGFAKTLLFTGGLNPRVGASEAVVMASGAVAAGVPEADILIEAEARNTDENMTLSLALIGRQRSAPLRSVIVVAIHFHLRRAVLTAMHRFPPDVRIGWVSYPSQFYRAEDWQQSARGRSDVEAEIAKIRRYLGPDLSGLGRVMP